MAIVGTSLTAAEIACVKELAKRFEQGRVNTVFKPEDFGLEQSGVEPMLLTMKLAGAISNFYPELEGLVVTIDQKAVQLARHYETDRKDIVESVKYTSETPGYRLGLRCRDRGNGRNDRAEPVLLASEESWLDAMTRSKLTIHVGRSLAHPPRTGSGTFTLTIGVG